MVEVAVQSLSRVRLFVTPMDCSTPGLPLLHYLPELAKTHVHWVDDAIQPSHPLSHPFAHDLNQGLYGKMVKFIMLRIL